MAWPVGHPIPPKPSAPPLQGEPWFYNENGRFYGLYKRGQYMWPIDAEEMTRLDIHHRFFLVARQMCLHTSPIPSAASGRSPVLLDVGAGSGIWCMDMADRYQHARVLGYDLNMIQPERIPANLSFHRHDVEETTTHWPEIEPNGVDLVHVRAMAGSIANWPVLYGRVFYYLRPGAGHLEQVEWDWNPQCHDGTLPERGALARWAADMHRIFDELGRPLRIDPQLTRQRLAAAGFVDIKESVFLVPYNGWSEEKDIYLRDCGRWFCVGMAEGMVGFSMAPFCRRRGFTATQVREMVDRVKEEICSRLVHAHCRMYVWTARKP